jgi:hypothetical protein
MLWLRCPAPPLSLHKLARKSTEADSCNSLPALCFMFQRSMPTRALKPFSA